MSIPATAIINPALEAPASLRPFAADLVIAAELALAVAVPVDDVVGLSCTTPPFTVSGDLTSAFFASSLYFCSVWSDPDLVSSLAHLPYTPIHTIRIITPPSTTGLQKLTKD